MAHFLTNQSTILYLQVILQVPQAQGLLEVLDSPRIEINKEKDTVLSKLLLQQQ